MCVDAHVSCCAGQRFSLTVGDVLLRLRVSVLLRHAKIHHMDDVGGLRAWPTDQEIVGLDVAVDEVLLVDGLHSRELLDVSEYWDAVTRLEHTICFATITTVFMENLRLQWSKRSSSDGPRRSMTRMLCRPSWPK